MKKIYNKVLLITVCNNGVSDETEEIGLCYIASYLRKNGYEVKLMQKKEEDIDYESIRSFSPNVIGMTIYEKSKDSVLNAAKKLKDMLPNPLISAGGAYPTYAYTELLKESRVIDYVMIGEGEHTFLELLERLQQGECLRGLKGLVYREDDEVIVNEFRELIKDINSLPMPARDIFVDNKLKIAMVSTSRGCLARCSFCSNDLFWKKWRGKDAVNVVNELEDLANKYGIDLVNFTDASFEDPDRDCKRLRAIAEEIIKRDLKISYMADFRAEFHKKANDDLMKLLIRSGLTGVCIGIESGNEEDLKVYRKIASLEDNIKVIELFKKYDISILPGIINFNPYSSLEGLHKNIDFMEKYLFADNIEFVMNRYRMYKGAALYEKIKEDNLLSSNNFNEVGYKFIDNRIEILLSYLERYIANINEKDASLFITINFFAQIFLMFISHLKRKISKMDDEPLQKVFSEFYDKYNGVREEINFSICSWVRELLYLAQNNWDYELANEISNKFFSEEYIKEVKNKYNIISTKFYIKLSRLNKELGEQFLNFIHK